MDRLRWSLVGQVAVMAVGIWMGHAVAQTLPEEKLAAALQSPKAMETAVSAGREASAFCANCHGADGNSTIAEVPNLAGQNPAYLLEQIRKFGAGQRKNEFMQGLIKVLSDDEKVNIALYYSQLPVKARSGGDPALLAKGQAWYSKICFRCHGNDGRGNEKIARLSGQQPEYLALTLKRYRDGTGERIDPAMAANTSMLKDADIQAVVEYVSHMK